MKFNITALVAALVILAFFSACSKDRQEVAPPPLPVTVSNPVQKKVIEYDDYTGRLEAVQQVEIRPRVSGYIQSVEFDEGKKVKKGDLLYVIDPRPFEAVVNRLKARVGEAEAGLTLAESNLKRAKGLIERNSISQEEADIRNSESLRAAAALEAAKAELAAAELELEFTRVTAPIDGIIDRELVTVGNLVNGESNNATLLTTIVQHDPIYAYYEIDERSFLRNVRRFFAGEAPGRGENVELPAYLGLEDEEGYPHEGRINFASNQLDPNTATITIRGIFENKDEFLTPGLFARIRVPVSKERDGLLIPDSAVISDQSLKVVWVVDDKNMANRKTVKLGSKYEGLRIVRSGLEPTDRIVITGFQFLQPGMKVDPKPGKIESTPEKDGPKA